MPVRTVPAVVTWFEPGDAGDPHVGAIPPAAKVPSSPPAPGGGHRVRAPGDAGDPHVGRPGREARHRCRSARSRPWSPGSSPRAMPTVRTPARSRPRPRSRARRRLRAASTGFEPRAMPAIRTSAAPAVRLDIDTGPHGPGRGHQVEPQGDAGGPHVGAIPGVVTWFDPGRCRRSARRRDPARGQGPELAAGSGRRSPGSTPGDASDPHVGRPGREARHRYRSARPRAWSPGRAFGRCRRSARRPSRA